MNFNYLCIQSKQNIIKKMKKIILSILLLGSVIIFTPYCKPDKPTDDPTGIRLDTIPYNPQAYIIERPAGFPAMDIPSDNPTTQEGVKLGHYLFFDKILSLDSTMSCSSCHLPEKGFTDGAATSKGVDGLNGTRSSMGLINIGFVSNINPQGHNFMWDGRFQTLEEQALAPVEDPIELHANWGDIEKRFRTHRFYPSMFRKAFGINSVNEITKTLAAKALAQYERSLVSANSRFDKFIKDPNNNQLSEQEMEGYELFFNDPLTNPQANPLLPDAQCGHCHNGPSFSNFRYANNGITASNDFNGFADKGFGRVTGIAQDNGKFKTTSLRNIELTAPYMHDGRFSTLEQTLDHYASGGLYSPNRAVEVAQLGVQSMRLNAQHKAALIAFMKTLTDTTYQTNPLFKSPF